MSSDKPLVSARFPRSAKYNSEWRISGSANTRWLSEWLAAALNLRPKTHEGWEARQYERTKCSRKSEGRGTEIPNRGPRQNAEHYERAASTPQTPHTLFIACADSRVDVEAISSSGPGEIFASRNIFQSGDALRRNHGGPNGRNRVRGSSTQSRAHRGRRALRLPCHEGPPAS